jgi:dTDP-4-amino-4,6-dideoxygalactose transaminase
VGNVRIQAVKARHAHAAGAVSAPIPLLDLRRQYEGLREEVLAAITRVCDSQGFILGPEVEALEREICALTGASGAAGCASGTEALWLALIAAGVEPGDSVITTAFSFFASASAIVRAGATPILLDVDPGTLNLDPAVVEGWLREHGARTPVPTRGSASAKSSSQSGKVRAILPVHLYGQCADMDAFDRIAREFKVAVVEDAAQAIGADWRGRGAGSLGATAAFSFYPTKNLSAYGDAGIATSTNPEAAERMRKLRNHGSPRRYYHDEFGWNGRIDAIQAAVLRVKLPYVAAWNEARRQHAATYDRLFAEAGLSRGPASSGANAARDAGSRAQQSPIAALARDPRATHVFHQYVILAHRRDELRGFLTEQRIGTEIYYPLPLHLQPVFSYLGMKEGDLPVAEQAAKEVLALPMFPELTEAEIRRVVDAIAEFYS